jgi:hypothetical protein
MANEASDWITAGIAAVAAVFAYWSAQSSERSAKAAELTQQRSVLREVVATAHSIVEEAARSMTLAEDWKQAHRAATVFTNNVGSSRDKLFKDELEAALSRIQALSSDARAISDQTANLTGTVEAELTIALGKLQGQLAQVRGERQKIEGGLKETREFIRPMQEQALTGKR